MPRTSRKERVAALALGRFEPDEELLGVATVWAARRTRVPLLLTGRHLADLVVSDRRLLLFPRRGRDRATPLLDEPTATLRLDDARQLVPMFRVLVRASDGRRYLFDFRPRDRVIGRELARALHAVAGQ